ncbi:MAG: hypothetical protein NZV14_01300 [Bryobacteraceae bacterium]|nr:hypothetical protein [Bryobacteraceae bacterium]MDW8376765.1 hypothetical protein [Bryobacterales bacterium]
MRLFSMWVVVAALLFPPASEAFPFQRKKQKQPETIRWGLTKQERKKTIQRGLKKNHTEARRKRSAEEAITIRPKASH